MIRKSLVVLAAGVLIGAPATATAQAAQPEPVAGVRDVAISTGSAAADVVINGLIAAIFGPNDPHTCKFPYCF
ncbi:hypothetical protein ACWELJ_19765 [Nocardia sp. NPDC004582]